MKFDKSKNEVELGDYIDHIKGNAFKSRDMNKNNDVPVIKVKNFTADSIEVDTSDLLPKSFVVEYERYLLKENDILISTVGSWPSNPESVVGKVVRVPNLKKKLLLNQNIVKVFSTSQYLDNSFLFWVLKSENFKQFIISKAQGSANQASITLKSIDTYTFELPSIEEQREISEFLNNIQNKIELNNQMIATLEELTATLFKRWFVDFEFPDENGNPYKSSGGKMVDSELGEIPEGWEVAALSNTFKHKKEVFNPRKYQNRDVLHFSMPSFDKNQMPISDNSDDIKSNKNIIGKYTVLFSKMNPEIKRVWLPNYKDGILNVTSTEFIVVDTNNKEEQSFLYSLLSSMSFQNYLLNNVTGSTGSRQRIKPNIAMQYRFAYNENYSKLLAEILCPLTSQIMDFRLENQSLNNLRDSLLPKLLSDELEL